MCERGHSYVRAWKGVCGVWVVGAVRRRGSSHALHAALCQGGDEGEEEDTNDLDVDAALLELAAKD